MTDKTRRAKQVNNRKKMSILPTERARAYIENYAKKNNISLSLSAQIFIAKGIEKQKKEDILGSPFPVPAQQGKLPMHVVPKVKEEKPRFFTNRMIG